MADVDLAQAYGYASSLSDIPEIKKILDEATANKWTNEMIAAAVQNSAYVKSHRQAQIDWEVLQRLHPQDAEAQKNALMLQIRQQATQLGFTLTDARVGTVAGWILNNGLGKEEANAAILAEFHYNPAAAKGQTATQAAQLKALAKQYLVPISDQAIGAWEDKILHGTDTIDSFEQYVRDQAKSMFPSLAGSIDAGHSTTQLLDPYSQLVTKELGLVNVDLTDPKYLGSLMQVDPKTGQRTMMSLDQWQTTLRTNPKYGWSGTTNAKNMTADFTEQLLQAMGAT